MAKKRIEWSPGFRPGREQHDQFSHLVSALGQDGAQTPRYSPSEAVDGAKGPNPQRTRGPESARNERRG